MAKDEPQSYGSQEEWVKGETGGKVSRQKPGVDSENAGFYGESRESEASASHQGGDVSEVQLAENHAPTGNPRTSEEVGTKKVTERNGGAIRGSYFKKRDYPE